MPPKKRRGGSRGRGRGLANRRGPKPRQPLSPDNTSADDTNAEGTSTNGNVSFEQAMLLPQSATTKKHVKFNEERELLLPRLKPTVIPENSSILSMLNGNDKSDYIMTDEQLDHTQWDLEAMLTNVIVRKNTIRDELSTLSSMKFDGSLIRTNSKLPKIRSRAAGEISAINECCEEKVKFDPTSEEVSPSITEPDNKFWSLVQPYLSHVKKEDLKWLDDLVRSYSPSKSLYEIPPIGEYYANNWASEELEMQKNQSSCSRTPKTNKFSERIAPDVVALMDKANSAINDGNVYRPVYQRVVAALLDQSKIALEDAEEHFPEFDNIEEKPQEMSNVCKEFYAEKNVKKQLCKLGLMGHNTKPAPTPEEPSLTIADEENDEVFEEIVKCDYALTQLREINKNHLTYLLERCRRDYYQQKIKKKIEKVNNEILHYKTQLNESCTEEKKIAQLSKKDDKLNFLLKQRGNYLEQLQSVASKTNKYLIMSTLDDLESSDEECAPTQILIENTPTENNTGDRNTPVKAEELRVEKKRIGVNTKQTKNSVNKVNEIEKYEKVINNHDGQTNVKINPIINTSIKNEESSCSGKSTFKQLSKKPKNDSLEKEQTSNIESRKPINIIQEPVVYADQNTEGLDHSEDVIDGDRRKFRHRKLNKPNVYFESYVGSISEGSDFTDLSD